jgi:RNA polymerase sigma-70 factor (ECF subfamily)
MGQLFKQHGPLVYRRALRLLGNAADAEEATQDIFIRAMKGADGFEQRSQTTTWLYQITTNHYLNVLRDRSRRAALRAEHLPSGEAASAEPARAEDIALVRRVLASADPQEAQAAVYVFIDGMSHEEAAPLLGVSKRTVGNWIERFRAAARAAAGDAPDPAAGSKP